MISGVVCGLRAHVCHRDADFAYEIRFDMVEAEFTHMGDQCTLEALVHANGLGTDAALVSSQRSYMTLT